MIYGILMKINPIIFLGNLAPSVLPHLPVSKKQNKNIGEEIKHV